MNTAKAVGIIAEYNPFHNGHAYQIQKAKELTGADYAVIVMSPDFVQRGEPAILEKYQRAAMALSNGADLVLSLPVCYACASAELFAEGAVSLLDQLGCISCLSFGCETVSSDGFRSLAEYLLEEPAEYRDALQAGLRCGLSYPAAREQALLKPHILPELPVSADELKLLVSSPNNILALEYCKALHRFQSSMLPAPVCRIGASYHDSKPHSLYSSATAVRNILQDPSGIDNAALLQAVPEDCCEILFRECSSGRIVTLSDFDQLLHYRLITLSHYDDFLDVSPDLSDRIRHLLPEYTDYMDFIRILQSRQYTRTRIARALLHILLDIRTSDLNSFRSGGTAFYARVLGFSSKSRPLLHKIKETSGIPLITKLANAKKILSGSAMQMLTQDIQSSQIYQTAVCRHTGAAAENDYQKSPFRV